MAAPPYLKRVSKSIHREAVNLDGYRGFTIHMSPHASAANAKVAES
jgi:hypothetical protein